MSTTDRDNDGIPDHEQITVEEIDAINRHTGEGLIDALRDPKVRAAEGRQADQDFDPDECEYVGKLDVYVIRDRKTNLRYQVNYTRLVADRKIELRAGHSIEGGVMGGRAQAFTTAALARMGSFGPLLVSFMAVGGTAPAILANTMISLLKTRVKNPTANAIIDQILGRAKLITLALALLLPVIAFAQVPALILDHNTLTATARTKEPGLSIGYTADRLEFRTRRSVLVGWVDVLLTARFERSGKRVQLVAQSLRAGPLGEQRGKRFEQARAGLLKLVDVESKAERVEVWRADPADPSRRVREYSQDVGAP